MFQERYNDGHEAIMVCVICRQKDGIVHMRGTDIEGVDVYMARFM